MTDQISVVEKGFDATIAAFEKIKDVATYLATSEAFVKDFVVKDKDGNVIIDENTNRPKINVADVAICLMTGHELELSIGGSLLYGKKLNQATYMAVMKGRSLGLDIATSMEKVVSIPTKNGYVSYTMVDIISSKLLQGGVQFLPFIKNYAPFYIYYNAVTKDEIELDKIMTEEDELLDTCFLVDASTTPETLKEAKDKGLTLLTRTRHGYYSKLKMTRTFSNGTTQTIYQRFSSLDAERAGLLPTWNEKGELLDKGKDNWISNTPQMMNNRCISIPGRIIGADLLHGIYTREEVVSAGVIDEKEAPIVDAEIVG